MLSWYDVIARVYDYGGARHYGKARQLLIEKMNLKAGDRILLIGCGTGLIFPFIQDKLDGSGLIIGLDASIKMLGRAKEKIDKGGWANIHLIHADARNLSAAFIAEETGEERLFDHVIGELSFSVMPDWQLIMQNSVSLLKEGGKLGVLDGYRGKRDLFNLLLNFLPRSDISRPISDYAKSLTKTYHSEVLGFGKIIFIGVGQK